ncbi:unnamed protein product [Phytomonas sp. Hart1]|nr:unnamed protein product [Phytomonas sp. Hart1]|eukprot:CCW66216.1 unnamed protein product [Phytomonas sp. isolate Hart1]
MNRKPLQPNGQDEGAKRPVINNSPPRESPPANSVISLLSTNVLSPIEDKLWLSKGPPSLDGSLDLGARPKLNLDTILALRLPIDVWEYISYFLSYTELLRLAGTCSILWYPILQRDSIWEQQLSFWHRNIMDLRCGALLLTAFVFGEKSSGYERFKRQRRLYALDAHREWHFREMESLEDARTGFFTVPLHLGQENTESDAAAPIALEPLCLKLGRATKDHTSRVPMPAVGQPFLGVNDSTQRLRIWHPIRPGEDFSNDWVNGAAPRNTPIKPQCDSMGEGLGDYVLDAPASLEEEEAMLNYALACSEAEMSGLAPPPPLFALSSHKSSRGNTSKDNSRLSWSGSPFNPSPGSSFARCPCMKPSEIMTLIDMINSGTTAQSLIPLVDTTKREDELFLLAMGETLKGARRRRLHLGNHHRALANNGQTTRHRLGPPAAGTNQSLFRSPSPPFYSSYQTERSPSSPEADMDEGNGRNGNGNENRQTAAMSGPTTPSAQLPPPPVNSMLRCFTGVLMEIHKREAYQLCEKFLGSSKLLDDFILFHTTINPWLCGKRGGNLASSAFGAGTRFFMLPELCRNGRIGLLVVDMVRMLIIVEDEKTARDDPAWMHGYARVDRSGRLVMPGSGHNAQYYERSELRPL